MEKKAYEVLTDNWPRKAPAGKGGIVMLTEIEAKYSVLSGDLKLSPGSQEKRAGKPKPDAAAAGNGEGEGA